MDHLNAGRGDFFISKGFSCNLRHIGHGLYPSTYMIVHFYYLIKTSIYLTVPYQLCLFVGPTVWGVVDMGVHIMTGGKRRRSLFTFVLLNCHLFIHLFK